MKTVLSVLVLLMTLLPSVSSAEWRFVTELRTGTGTEPEDKLDAARLLMFDRDWAGAVVALRKVMADRREPLRDEAAFWLAHSLFQMGKASDALEVIGALESQHPRSRWLMPARSLRVEIATRTGSSELLWRAAQPPAPPAPPTPVTPPAARAPRAPRAVGVPPPPAPPDPPPPPPVMTMTDVRIQALSGLLLEAPDRAVPALREIVVQHQETPQARRALFVLGLSPHEQALETVMHFATTGPDALRVVAVEQLARWPSADAKRTMTYAYSSGSPRVKLQVLQSLGASGGASYLYEIVTTEDDPDLRESGILGLAHARGRAELARLYARTSAPRAERTAILEALCAAGADRELVTIVRQERDARLRDAAIAQLRTLNTPVALRFLRTLK
jgi:hypothetical protein